MKTGDQIYESTAKRIGTSGDCDTFRGADCWLCGHPLAGELHTVMGLKAMAFSKRIVHDVDERSSPSLFRLLRDFLGAYIARTKAWSEPQIGETTIAQKLDAIIEMLHPVANLGFIKEELSIVHRLQTDVLTAINNLDRKVDTMSSNIDRIEKEAADAAENVGLVRTAVEGLRTVSEEMKAEIAALKEQVAQGQIDQARLDAAAATFEKADDDIDAIVLPPPDGETGGETGGGTEG